MCVGLYNLCAEHKVDCPKPGERSLGFTFILNWGFIFDFLDFLVYKVFHDLCYFFCVSAIFGKFYED